jgi:D-alanyl-lipoteichoic acid acyltransferase DltB (MBOAT superfamily)
MLFNSYAFIFLYLPLVLIGFFQLARFSQAWAAGWLAAASLGFYGYWNPVYVGLLLTSIVGNYAFGQQLAQTQKRSVLALAIVANLVLLGYFKYANFFLESVNSLAGTHGSLGAIILPLGISFFTFTQIAFLVDTYQGKVKEQNFIHYVLFVTYFPHLIAGPVLHHKEMMPQFRSAATYRFNYENLAVGLTIFFIGLFKKVMLADGIAVYVAPVFDAPAAGIAPTMIEAWGGALCYTLQLYFDFSGYSDMAIGLSRLFGVTLPLNFHSPYKAVNIIEFWRRWHITLSRFLRDYLYIPLGGNRHGTVRRYGNLFVTMLLGGLWHGAGWTFVLWGALHGLFLTLNHAWHAVRRQLGQDPTQALSRPWHALSVLLTFLLVVIAWVCFRATDFHGAQAMLSAMMGGNGFDLPDYWLPKWGAFGAWLQGQGVAFTPQHGLLPTGAINWIWLSLLIVWLAPNTQEIMANFKPALDAPATAARRLLWRPTVTAALLIWGLAFVAIINLNRQSTFLYFQF